MDNENLLLNTATAKHLYHKVAKLLPLIDYHNHLNPVAMASDKKYSNITKLWIYDDQYKHRLMRINGIPEKHITGNASDAEKFDAWVKTYPNILGNPLHHWSQLEMLDIFGLDFAANLSNSQYLYEQCNQKLGTNGLSTMDILQKWNVETLCTSDDLLDDVTVHENVANVNVYPSLRADTVIAFETEGFLKWLQNLSNLTAIAIKDLVSYQAAIEKRLEAFIAAGCTLSDHALDSGFSFDLPTESVAEAIFKSVLQKKNISTENLNRLQSYLLKFLGICYGKRSMTMQLHIGAQRTTSSRLKSIAGRFGGFATIGNPVDIGSLCCFMDLLESEGYLPNTILYTLNPNDNERMATLTGSFPGDGVRGKIQFGPAWWFNDHLDGIQRQLTDVASYGLLNVFIGMTSDSRSFLSLSRHYYFRRVLCRLLGNWAEDGLIPQDTDTLSGLVTNVCYLNAKKLITKQKIYHEQQQ